MADVAPAIRRSPFGGEIGLTGLSIFRGASLPTWPDVGTSNIALDYRLLTPGLTVKPRPPERRDSQNDHLQASRDSAFSGTLPPLGRAINFCMKPG
jgi:hypothetical protein